MKIDASVHYEMGMNASDFAVMRSKFGVSCRIGFVYVLYSQIFAKLTAFYALWPFWPFGHITG